jgi:ABC-type dipeptide/oligopeptide/nickel transport system ATPase component
MTEETTGYALDVTNLGVTFGRQSVRAVDRVSLYVRSGERVGIVGESGSGKSTTALSVLQLHDRRLVAYDEASSIRVGGEDIMSTNARRLRALRGGAVGMVFQDPLSSLNPVFRVGTQVRDVVAAHFRISKAESRARALTALRDAGMPEPEQIYRRFPFELSGGLRQRVVIAMAIACEPSLLIADEPTSALDATVQAEVLRTFRRLCSERSMGLLLISHDIGVIYRMCDRVYVMYQGRVVEEGPAERVIGDPQHAYTKTLIDSALYRQARTPGNAARPDQLGLPS